MRAFERVGIVLVVAGLGSAWLSRSGGATPTSSSSRAQAIEEEEVEYGDVPLAATLIVPAGDVLVPGVVVVHGSGTSDRSNPWTSAYARSLAARGIAVLHPDKRGSGKSGGDWRTASFEDLAADASAGVAVLASLPEIDSEHVGVIGFSQGGPIASIVAAKTEACRFAITISGSTLPLFDQIVDEVEMACIEEGRPLSSEELARVRELHAEAAEFARTGAGFDELQGRLAAARSSRPSLRAALRGFPSSEEHWLWSWIRSVGNFDPLPHWQALRKPVVFVFGGQDAQVRARSSIARLLDAVGGERRELTVLLHQSNGHALHREDLVDFLARWIRDPRG